MPSNWIRLLQRACVRSFQPSLITVLLILPGWRMTLALAAQTAPSALVPSSVSAPATAPFSGAGIGTGARTIDGLWQFHTGDDPDGKLGWAQPGFDDSQWERLAADGPWVNAPGHPSCSGFAWYRRQIALDPADKNPLGLYLPAPYTAADVYWNGTRVGGVGSPAPHPFLPWNPDPAAIPLPSSPGAGSGMLALRLWAPPQGYENDCGFQAAPQLGYAPLILQMRESWVEHALRRFAVGFAVDLILLCAGLIALVLWLRSRSQWILFCVGAYFVSYALDMFSERTLALLDFRFQESFFHVFDWINHTAFLFLILLLANLLNRPGVRGFRFWKRVCLASSALVLLGEILACWPIWLATQPPSALFQFLDALPDLRDYAEGLSLLLVLIACLVLSKPRLPRLLFMAAAALAVFLGDLVGLLRSYPGMSPILQFIHKDLFEIYGSGMPLWGAANLLLLLAIVYAVWDQLSGQLAEQRRVNAEMKAAHEVQEILVPAASSEDAPGYAVASVYRPASEVGGDFFQIVPLPDQSTLIVAGDVSGKGLRAAMTVSLIVGAIRTLAEQDPSPASILAGLNRRLIGRTQGGFATCCALLVNPAGHAVIANAGHCQPYIDGKEIELPNGIPLGIVDGITYEETDLTLPEGAQVVLVSDGVVEARNEKGVLYGFERLNQLIANKPTAQQIADTAVAFGQDDDITVLTLMRLAAV